MPSLILRTLATWLLPVLVLGSFFLLLRGHNAPGGGFAGGLLAAAGYVLTAIAFGTRSTCSAMRVGPRMLLGLGLATATASALVPVAALRPPLTGLWTTVHIYRIGELHLGTPMLFDLGVYLLVLGAVTSFILGLAEAQARWNSG